MEQVNFLLLLILCVQTTEGFIWNSNTILSSVCVGNSISLAWVYTLESGESHSLTSWTKSDGAGGLIVLGDSFGGLTPTTEYDGRLTRIGNAGIRISNATLSDIGTYIVIVTLISGTEHRMNGTVRVHENATASCKPTCDSNLKCQIPQACPVKSYIDAVWTVEGVKYPNVFSCLPNNYNKPYNVCAEGEAVTSCYSVPSLWCEEHNCKGTTTTTNITVTSSSLSSTTSSATTYNTSTTPTTNGPSVSTTSSTFTSISPTTVLPCNDTNNTSISRSPTGSNVSATSNISASTSSTAVSPANNTSNASTSTNPTKAEPTAITKTSTGNNGIKNKISDTDVKVIAPAVVVPCGLLIIGAIVLVVFCVRRKARKNVHESPDGMAIQDKGNNIDGWKQSLGHGKATDNLDTLYTTPDGFIIYPGPAAESTARSYKNKKYHGVTDQYSRPNPGSHHHQADYIPSTYTSARAYTHRGKKHHVVTDQYSRPYPDTYGYQTVYFPSTYMSARTYAQKGKTYEGHQPASNLMANSRLAYDQTAYYPQTGYCGQSGQDVYYSGGGQHPYGQRSRSHHDYNGRKQERDYYNQYEMADYGGNGAGYRQTKQDTAFYY